MGPILVASIVSIFSTYVTGKISLAHFFKTSNTSFAAVAYCKYVWPVLLWKKIAFQWRFSYTLGKNTIIAYLQHVEQYC